MNNGAQTFAKFNYDGRSVLSVLSNMAIFKNNIHRNKKKSLDECWYLNIVSKHTCYKGVYVMESYSIPLPYLSISKSLIRQVKSNNSVMFKWRLLFQ